MTLTQEQIDYAKKGLGGMGYNPDIVDTGEMQGYISENPIPYLSTANAETQITDNNIKYPQTNPAIPLPQATTKTVYDKDTGKEMQIPSTSNVKDYGDKYSETQVAPKTATFVNADGQTVKATIKDMDNPDFVQKLKDSGYNFMESDSGFIPSMDLKPTVQTADDKALAELEQTKQDFYSYNVDQDPEFQARASSIKQQYDILEKQMAKTNEARAKALSTLGMRGGTTEFAGGVQMGLEGEELNQANTRIGELQRQEADAVSSARSAYQAGKWSLYEKKIELMKDTRDKTSKALEDYNTKLQKSIDTQKEEERMSNLNNAVIDSINIGKSNPVDILNDLTKKGIKVTAKEISDTLKYLSKDLGIDTDGMTTNLKEYYSIVNQGLTSSLPLSIISLPENQRAFAYVKYKEDLATKAKRKEKETNYIFSNDDKGKLIGGGLSNSVIDYIQNGINQYGINEVLTKETGLTENQKNLILQTVSGKIPDFINDQFITDVYDDATLRKAANKGGYNVGGGLFIRDYGVSDDQLTEFKTDLLKTVEIYRKMGIAEKDIQAKLDKKIQDLVASY